MGMYTQLVFKAELKHVQLVTDTLKRFAHSDHEFFSTYRYPLICNDIRLNRNTIAVRCELKNYDNEIQKFLDWIMPYVQETNEILGFYLYEEDDFPTFIYYKDF